VFAFRLRILSHFYLSFYLFSFLEPSIVFSFVNFINLFSDLSVVGHWYRL
jgi:hypothetical protein